MSLLLYSTFNEQGSHDLSQNNNDGTDTSITYSAADVGFNAVLNATTDSINFGNITELNNQAAFSFYMRIKFVSAAGNYHVFGKTDVFGAFYNGTDFTVVCNGVTLTIPTIDVGSFYNIHYVYTTESSEAYLYSNNVLIDSAAIVGNTPSNANSVYLGNNADVLGANFEINELKVYNNTLSEAQRQSHIDNVNGVDVGVFKPSIFNVGDILVANELISAIFSICTFANDNSIKIQPITAGLRSDMLITRVGHLWNTERQYYNRITDSGIKYYQGVSLSTEYNTDAKLTKQDTVLSNQIMNGGTVDTDKNNFDLSQEQDLVILTPNADRIVSGIISPSYAREIVIVNESSEFNIQYLNESNLSTEVNRIRTGLGNTFIQQPQTTVKLLYDNITNRWRFISAVKSDNLRKSFRASADYSISIDDDVVVCTQSLTITLRAALNIKSFGETITIKNGLNTVVRIEPQAGETIDDSPFIELTQSYVSVTLISINAGEWSII